MAKREDEGILEGQWDDLNRAFYRTGSGPHAYIRARLATLRSMVNRDVRTVESVNLLHHAAEALVRQFLAHRGAPDCPWLELSRLRNFSESKAAVSELGDALAAGERPDDVVAVFYGAPDGDPASAPDAGAGPGLGALLRYASDVLLDEAGMYNAIKHGIAAVPGKRAFPDEIDGRPFPRQRGGGMSLLTLQPLDADDGRRWTRVITYVDAEENIAMVALIAEQLENLWNVARAKYLGEPLASLHPLAEEMADRVRSSTAASGLRTVLEVGFSLLYRDDDRGAADGLRNEL